MAKPGPKPKSEKAPLAISANEMEELVRKRDAFVTSMAMLRNAADEASRAGLAYFDILTLGATHGVDLNALRALSVAPGLLDETDGRKRRKKRELKPKDPDAPKKPSTPYFLFCSHGREAVKKDLGENATFQEVQQELKNRWEALEDKQKWSDLYQKLLGDWKVRKSKYDDAKAVAEGDAAAASVDQAPEAPASGFTAVNSRPVPKSTANVTESDDEEDEEVETAEEPEAAEEEEDDEEDEAPQKEEEPEEKETSPESSLTPPPKETKTPRTGRKGAKNAPASQTKTPAKSPAKAPEPAPSTSKKRKSRSTRKQEEAAPEPAPEVAEETPKRKRSKRRKSGAADQ